MKHFNLAKKNEEMSSIEKKRSIIRRSVRGGFQVKDSRESYTEIPFLSLGGSVRNSTKGWGMWYRLT